MNKEDKRPQIPGDIICRSQVTGGGEGGGCSGEGDWELGVDDPGC